MAGVLRKRMKSRTNMISYLREFNKKHHSVETVEEYEAILPDYSEEPQYLGNIDEKREVLLTAATMWQQLETHFFGEGNVSDVDTIIYDIGEGHMGLLGPSDGCITRFAEMSCGRFTTFRLHALAHDVSGRFRKKHGLGPGYLYTIPFKEDEYSWLTWMRGVEFMGNVFGLWNSFKHRNELTVGKSFELIRIHV